MAMRPTRATAARPPTPACIAPDGVALDASGNLYIADAGQQSHPQGGHQRHHHHRGGQWHVTAIPGDGGAATNASLNYPSGVAVDAAGNLYIADNDNNRIRKVDTNGIITTVAGNGSARLFRGRRRGHQRQPEFPSGVALDAAGNLYIADSYNQRIRKVDTNGIITTVAGNGTERLFRGRRRGHQRQPELVPPAWPWMPSATCILLTWQQPHPQGGHQRHHHHRGGQWQRSLFRGWRRGHQRQPELPLAAWPWMPPATSILPTQANQSHPQSVALCRVSRVHAQQCVRDQCRHCTRLSSPALTAA